MDLTDGGYVEHASGKRKRRGSDDHVSYHLARERRWWVVKQAEGMDGEHRHLDVPATSLSGAERCETQAGRPAASPGRYSTGEPRRYTADSRTGLSAMMQPRKRLKTGAGVMFDNTSPHSAPGVMPSEGVRHVGGRSRTRGRWGSPSAPGAFARPQTLYLGYQGPSMGKNGAAPLLAHPPATGEPEGAAWQPVFRDGEFQLRRSSQPPPPAADPVKAERIAMYAQDREKEAEALNSQRPRAKKKAAKGKTRGLVPKPRAKPHKALPQWAGRAGTTKLVPLARG